MIAVLYTDSRPLIIRGNPTLKEVKGFVKEHSRRYKSQLPGGPSGVPARRIVSAYYFKSEPDWFFSQDDTWCEEIDISEELI